MKVLSRSLNRLMVPALAAGLLVGGLSVSQAQSYTYTSTNTAATVLTTSPGSNNVFGAGNTTAFFVDTAGESGATSIGVPTNIRPFTITPMGTSGSATFNDTFNITIYITSNGSTVPFSFDGFTLAGTLNNNGSKTDTVDFTLNNTVITHAVDGSVFTIQAHGSTPPGTSGGTTPDGTIGFRVTATPEPGAVAMLIGMGVSGSALAFRRRRAVK